MKTLYLECAMGAAGDMLCAALLEVCPDPDAFLKAFHALGIPGVSLSRTTAQTCGITGTHVTVSVNGQVEDALQAHAHLHGHEDDHGHAHSHDAEHGHTHEHEHAPHAHAALGDIQHLISHLHAPQAVLNHAQQVYGLIAQAESRAHGRPVDQVHFHEVGALDAVADVVACCLLMDMIAPDRVIVSPIHVGSGQVKTAHGVLPVPAPATAHILMGCPTYCGQIQGELCTPTGAALIKHFANSFGPMPSMAVTAIGYGVGTKQFAAANCVRAFLGDVAQGENDALAQLSCNLDDMTPEAIAFAGEQLFSLGALDVFSTPIQMKKGRPGVLLTCICAPEDADRLAEGMLRHTTTLGVRKQLLGRYRMARNMGTVQTPYGPIRIKYAQGYGQQKAKPEYEDIARAAREHGVTLETVLRAALAEITPGNSQS
nr:nickel pincer cofactor biosynthesis protein LarC [bacterium]